jgi:DNA-binding GntR family transcriptional regulator
VLFRSEHHGLLSAIKGGDVEGARRIAGEQAAASQLMVLDALLSSDAVLSANVVAAGE